ncbi:MAG: DsbA family protein, partial [Candidatus Korobacteraceae bacterium]
RLRFPVGPDVHVQGPPDALVSFVDYGDYECPHCGRAHPITKLVKEHFGDDLRFVFRHFPLTQIHPSAMAAAETAEWAGTQGKFWEMHDLLFRFQRALSPATLLELAAALNLSPESLADSLERGVFRERVARDFTSGVRSGVNGTPTFFINGERYDGSWELSNLITAIQRNAYRKAS